MYSDAGKTVREREREREKSHPKLITEKKRRTNTYKLIDG
jgi:hypothetical protein